MRWRSAHLVRWSAIAVIAAVIIGAAAPTFVRTWSGRKNPDDFAVVYSGARAMWNHEDIYAATKGMYIYSPFLAFIFQPLARLPQRLASLTWITLSALIILTASLAGAANIWKTWAPTTKDGPLWPSVISASALLLSFEKIRSDFTLGQTDCLIIIGLVAALICLPRRPGMTGVVIGATANVKYLALIFIPYFIIKRKYRAAVSAMISFLFFFILPAVEVGFGLLKTYAVDATAVLARVIGVQTTTPARTENPVVNSIVWDHSVSLTSAILRETRWHRISDLAASGIILILFILVAGAVALIGHSEGVEMFHPKKDASSEDDRVITIEWVALIVLALVFGPQTTARHMIVLLVVFIVAMTIFFIQPDSRMRTLLVVAMLASALALSLPFRDTGVHPILITLKSVGAASWCAVGLMFSVVWAGSRTISKTRT